MSPRPLTSPASPAGITVVRLYGIQLPWQSALDITGYPHRHLCSPNSWRFVKISGSFPRPLTSSTS